MYQIMNDFYTLTPYSRDSCIHVYTILLYLFSSLFSLLITTNTKRKHRQHFNVHRQQHVHLYLRLHLQHLNLRLHVQQLHLEC